MNKKQRTGFRGRICLMMCMLVAFMFTSKPAYTSGDSRIYEKQQNTSFYLKLNSEKIKELLSHIEYVNSVHILQETLRENEATAAEKTKKADNTDKNEKKEKTKDKNSAVNNAADENNTADKSNTPADNKGTALTVTATAYCGCYECNGQWTGHPAADGTQLLSLHTIAAPQSIPFGTKVYIPYFDSYSNGGMFEVHDRGSAITEGRIDIYFDSHEEALAFGMRELKIYIK